uniref:Synaptotagmin IXa n=1 Tax=Sphaeramia orbicularis TaxID=375764 RepID=A0A673A075_9TELE
MSSFNIFSTVCKTVCRRRKRQRLVTVIPSFTSFFSLTACGLALFGVSLFVSWKLCWIPWRERGLSPTIKEPVYTAVDPPVHNRRESSHCSIATPEAAMKISHTSPDIPLDAQSKSRENGVHTNPRMQRQTTEPSSNGSIRRHMNLSNPDFNVAQFQRQDSLTGMGLGLGRLKPELYKQRSLEGDEGSRRGGGCGRLHFILKFDCDLEQLIVKIHKAEDLPAKDFSGTSDPYVKIYLLPDRMTKHQTKVHRKTLNPVFDEVFLFPVAYSELPTRKLHFSVYDFDRFSRHDIIGQVVVDNFLDLADFPRETKLCRDIQYVSSVSKQLIKIMLSSPKCIMLYLKSKQQVSFLVTSLKSFHFHAVSAEFDNAMICFFYLLTHIVYHMKHIRHKLLLSAEYFLLSLTMFGKDL